MNAGVGKHSGPSQDRLGLFRCDVNVSVNVDGKQGNRCEVRIHGFPVVPVRMTGMSQLKNLNSFKAIAKAIEYEVERQSALIRSNKPVKQQTRRYDVVTGRTVSV